MEWYKWLTLAVVLGGTFWVWRTLFCSGAVSCVGCGRVHRRGRVRPAPEKRRETGGNRPETVLTNGEKRI